MRAQLSLLPQVLKCTKCGETKPPYGFDRDKYRPSGYTAQCKECRGVANRAWKAANAERIREKRAEWRRQNPETDARWLRENRERRRQYERDWYQANRERIAARERARREANPQEWHALKQLHYDKRRALKLAAYVEDVDPLVVLERDDGVCGICGGDVDPFDFQVDHVIPLSRGGEHSYANVQVAHESCNKAKYDRLPDELAAASAERQLRAAS